MKKLTVTILALLALATMTLAAPVNAATTVTLYVELNEWMSCPFLFTWDGQNYTLENDIFSVGRGQNKEYTDYLSIRNSVRPKDGVYSFLIREIPSERSFTDRLKLITIDHPANVDVGVDSSGNAHSYSNPLSPITAIDGSGQDVTSSVVARDAAGASMYQGDVLTLDFSSVNITNGAKLVMTVNGFEGDPTGAVITAIPAIQIQTLESGAWVTRHTFFPKELMAEGVFDLKQHLTESQKVRLVSISCLMDKYHVIDYVGLDNTADTLSYSVLDPLSAVLNNNTDILSQILNSDNQYAFTQNEDTIALTFACNPLTSEERDFVFLSEGYYEPGGNTYYVDTWSGSSWVNRGNWMLYSQGDQLRSLNIGPYLPDIQGEYKIRLRNSMSYSPQWAYVDMVYLVADGVTYYPYEAKEEGTNADILSSIMRSDDIKWNSMNKASVIKFSLNAPPSANAGGPYTVGEGSTIVLNGTGSDPDGNLVTLAWDLDNDGQYDDAVGANPTFSAASVDGPSTRNIGLQASESASLSWDFENVTSNGGISTSVGSAGGASISGFVTQTGGGPAENFGGSNGWVFLTRFLGPTNYPYIQITTTVALNLDSLSFFHIHNHNPGFPTQNGYQVQLQIDSGSGYTN